MFSVKEFGAVLERCPCWEQKALVISKDIIKKSKSINFLREAELNSQLFGKLIFFMPNDLVLDLSVVLIKMNLCIQTEKYLNEIIQINDKRSSILESDSRQTDDNANGTQQNYQCDSYKKK